MNRAPGSPANAARVAAIADHTPGFYTALAPMTPGFQKAGDALVSVIPRAQGSTAAGRALVGTLRSRLASAPGHPITGRARHQSLHCSAPRLNSAEP